MNIVDLLVTIVVVTILVTIVLAVITYIAYKLRLAREPERSDSLEGPQYFIPYPPPEATDDPTGEPAPERHSKDGKGKDVKGKAVKGMEGHATEA
jgi:hypothetical protein